MSLRELVVLGTASQAPTRHRNHNGYLLLFDADGFLFDPGEGTQRQMLQAGCSAGQITRICVTHFHGDHALGLPGVIQRLSLDQVPHPVFCHYPASGAVFFDRLRQATAFHPLSEVVGVPVDADGPVPDGGAKSPLILTARALDHRIDCYGYRVVEPDSRRMLPERLVAHGISGPDITRLQTDGHLVVGDSTVALDDVSVPRRGQVFAFVMDTRLCPSAFELAADADLLVTESTFLNADEALAADYGHLTAGQAGRLAAESGARELVLTHFSQRYRYEDSERFRDEAAERFDGPIHLAEDLGRVDE
jgi:ribonuclease Z